MTLDITLAPCYKLQRQASLRTGIVGRREEGGRGTRAAITIKYHTAFIHCVISTCGHGPYWTTPAG